MNEDILTTHGGFLIQPSGSEKHPRVSYVRVAFEWLEIGGQNRVKNWAQLSRQRE